MGSNQLLAQGPKRLKCGPNIRYCCSVWGCCCLTEINHLQKLQNRAARIITGSRFEAPGLQLVKRLGWKTIDELISSESNIMVFKSLHGLAPQYMSNLFTKTSQLTSRKLRNSAADLRVPKIFWISGSCKCYENKQEYNLCLEPCAAR